MKIQNSYVEILKISDIRLTMLPMAAFIANDSAVVLEKDLTVVDKLSE